MNDSALAGSGDPSAGLTSGRQAELVCPICRGQLDWQADGVRCTRCETGFGIVEGTPVLVAERADVDHDELDHLAGSRDGADSHKATQASWFDRGAMAEFEIERPFGSPRFYRFMLEEKFRRSIAPLGGRLDGWTALTVCGGSGMDAELLARSGAEVVSSDLSIGASGRARERARRHGTDIDPIVADIEHLPFADRSIDLVYVHDGLHHLEDPAAGIAEMARVARRAISITEPARAAATAVGIRIGLARAREEAGNRVARLDPREVTAQLESAGLRIVRSDRYAMYYHHVPGRMISMLSRQPLLAGVETAWRVANRVIGRFGNKLTIVAVR